MKKSIVFGVSIAGVGVASLLVWYFKSNSKNKQRLEIRIPNTAVGHVIGRAGSTIKNIKTNYKASIKFVTPDESDSDSNYTTCVIKGDRDSVELAAGVINNIVKNFNDEYAESEVSSDFDLQMSEDGLFQTISNAVDNVFKSRANGFVNHDLDMLSTTQTENVFDFIAHHTQKLCSPGGDGLIPVYVSAVASPSKFWLQTIKTKEHAELDRMTMEISEYFDSDSDLNVPPPFSDIKLGYLCVVYNEDDKRWYRAEVRDVLKNNDSILDTNIDLYLLDFGESIYAKVMNCRAIPPRFLCLNFQAIECGLSHVKAIGGDWSEEAIQFFEDIVHVCQWCPLMACVDFHEEGYRPYVTLIDTNEEASINIGEKLVSSGYAEALK